MKSEKTEDNSNKKRGSRLKSCRELRNLTQEALSEAVHLSTNYVSMLERGDRVIDWDKAKLFSEVLNVSPAFIMCESDIVERGRRQTTLDLDTFGERDLLFLHFIIAAGHSISFHVVRLHDGKKPLEREFHGQKYYDWSSLQEEVSISQLEEVCLSDAKCKLREGDTLSEVVIVSVTLNNTKLSYGEFVFTVNRLYDYMDFSLGGVREFKSDYEYLTMGMDNETDALIKETRLGGMEELKIKDMLNQYKVEATLESGEVVTPPKEELFDIAKKNFDKISPLLDDTSEE